MSASRCLICATRVCRAVRMAFWDYNAGAALTEPCDEDVDSICVQTKRTKGVFSIGSVGRCLSKQLASRGPLSGDCRKLVTVAAPKDVRVYLQVRRTLQLSQLLFISTPLLTFLRRSSECCSEPLVGADVELSSCSFEHMCRVAGVCRTC